MKQRGFTLIELMVVIAIIVILAMVAVPAIVGAKSGNSNISVGINGITESRCIEGYKFIIGDHGRPQQILDEFGKGVRCGNEATAQPAKPYSN